MHLITHNLFFKSFKNYILTPKQKKKQKKYIKKAQSYTPGDTHTCSPACHLFSSPFILQHLSTWDLRSSSLARCECS